MTEKRTPEEFGQWFSQVRDAAGLTMVEMASVLEVGFTTIYRWQSGQHIPRSLHDLRAINRLAQRNGLDPWPEHARSRKMNARKRNPKPEPLSPDNPI